MGKEKTTIRVGDLYVYGDPNSRHGRTSEYNSGIEFALKNEVPFYFVEKGQHEFGNRIFVFEDGTVKPISLEGKTTYQNYLHEYERLPNGRFSIDFFNLEARNQFTSDAINYLFNNTTVLAHIGGHDHFSSLRLREGMELNKLVEADEKIVHDLVRDRIIYRYP